MSIKGKFPDSQSLAAALRIHILEMITPVRGSHIGSALSAADILAVLYYDVLRYDPDDPTDDSRDRLIFSKGHAGSALYAVLAESGFFPVSTLEGYCRNGSFLSGHVSSHNVAGVEFSTGSLGHGLPVGAGLAYSLKKRNNSAAVTVIMGDGECDEGTTWETAIFAAAHKLNNLNLIIDRNRIQALGNTEDIMPLEPLQEKWQSFNWHVSRIDGHDHDLLCKTLMLRTDKPHCIIADTIKGRGVSYMENSLEWHYRTPNEQLFKQAITELGGKLK